MTPVQVRSYSLANMLGIALLLFGATLLYLRIETALQHLDGYFSVYGADLLGVFPAAGLLVARVLQTLTFDPVSSLSVSLRFLLSCWPVAAVFLGALLLRKNMFSTPNDSLESNSDLSERGTQR